MGGNAGRDGGHAVKYPIKRRKMFTWSEVVAAIVLTAFTWSAVWWYLG